MARKSKDYTPPTPAEQRALRDQRLAQQNVPNGEAGRRELKLLQHYASAQEDLQWIVDNNAWTDLGFETFTGWYSTNVVPVVRAAGLRPTQEFALYVLTAVRADEAMRPPAQRLLQRELAGLVGVSESTLRRLAQDRPQPSNGAGADLEQAPKPPIVEAIRQAIEDAGKPQPESTGVVACEQCAGPIDPAQAVQGYARCDTCDPDGDHVRPELDDGGRGECAKCNPAPEEPTGFTARQREDAARQLGYLELGALKAVGPVKHFMDVDCPVAENAEETPLWATDVAKTTCLDCLRLVVEAQNSGDVGSSPTGVPGDTAADSDTASADGSTTSGRASSTSSEPAGGVGGRDADASGNPLNSSGDVLEGEPSPEVSSPAGRPEASDMPGEETGPVATDRPGIDSSLARDETGLPHPVAAETDSPAGNAVSAAQNLTDEQAPWPPGEPVPPPGHGVVIPGGEGEAEEPLGEAGFSADPASDWMGDWRALVHSASTVRWHLSETELAEIRDNLIGLGRIFRPA